MAFIDKFIAGFSGGQILEMLIRLIAAAVLGGIVGIERSKRFKDAGVRTHSMVGCASALLMVISKYGFLDLINQQGPHTWNTDPARIAAGIVTGVSFLGAGIIYRDYQQHSLKGLTTAAGVWCVAGIGMATGAGMYFLAVFATLLIVLLQFIMHRFPIGNDKYSGARLEIVLDDDPSSVDRLSALLKKWDMVMEDSDVERLDGKLKYTLDVKMHSKTLQNEINRFIAEYPEIRSFKLGD
ncbi:MAG: MgtC/SapB family protein [Firmicutes bacterium]|nr:MgtC/SapB family protein [Bacillota bacterium]